MVNNSKLLILAGLILFGFACANATERVAEYQGHVYVGGEIQQGPDSWGTDAGLTGYGFKAKGKTGLFGFGSLLYGVWGSGEAAGGRFDSKNGYGVYSKASKNFFTGPIGVVNDADLSYSLNCLGNVRIQSDKNGFNSNIPGIQFASDDGTNLAFIGMPNTSVVGLAGTAQQNVWGIMMNVNDGKVGIGGAPSRAKLDVVGYGPYQHLIKMGWLDTDGAHSSGSGFDAVYSIYTDNNIWSATGVVVSSDERIKKIIDRSNGEEDLKTLSKLKVADYEYVDTIAKGKSVRKGFIAQEVEKVYPRAVSKTSEFIPNIYKSSDDLYFDADKKTLKIVMPLPPDLKVGDVVQLITEDGKSENDVVSVGAGDFVVKDWNKETKNVFVFGKKVNDYRVLDYDSIFSLNVSAAQELSKQVDILKAEISSLKAELTELKGKNGNR